MWGKRGTWGNTYHFDTGAYNRNIEKAAGEYIGVAIDIYGVATRY